MNLKEVEDTPLWSFAMDKLNRAIYYMVHKEQKGDRKWIYKGKQYWYLWYYTLQTYW